MKRLIIALSFIIWHLSFSAVQAQDNPRMTTMSLTAKEMAHYMAPAWNLGNTMEAGDNTNSMYKNVGISTETSWQSTKTTQEVIDYVASKGFKSVRIPCAWVMGHITNQSDMTIDPAWMARVREIIDYCLKANLNVFINDHWDGGWIEHDGFTTGANTSDLNTKLRKLWTNIANGLKDYDERVIFGGMNEPGVGGASPAASGSLIFDQYGTPTAEQMQNFVSRIVMYEQTFIDAVRATGGNNANRILVVQGPSVDIEKTAQYFSMSKLTDSAKDRLMLEVHFYSPYQFCQMSKDEDWGKMQFYWKGSDSNLETSTHAGTYDNYSVTSEFVKMKNFFVKKDYPVIVGEYGAMWRNMAGKYGEDQDKHNKSLQYWYSLVTQNCMKNGLIPFQWDTNHCDYGGSSSIDRSKPGDGISWILNGIMEGAEAGMSNYTSIYPEPSIDAIETIEADNTEKPSAYYTLAGMEVAEGVTAVQEKSLTKGVYIHNHRKHIVK